MQVNLNLFCSLVELKKHLFQPSKGEVMELNRKLKMGMVGGGRDAFIGAVHRNAALMDGKVEFIAGALSSDPEKSKSIRPGPLDQ